jgi:hypothetical protein
MPRVSTKALARPPIPLDAVERRIYFFRNQKVMLDSDLAALYGVPTAHLNQAVKRNRPRFPDDFMFHLTPQETSLLISQYVTSNAGRGGRRKPAFAFTELGVAMLSSVLRSERAVQMNIVIMRGFVRLRQALETNRQLAARIAKLEAGQQNHSSIMSVVIQDIENLAKRVAKEFHRLTSSPRRRKPFIGFYPGAK